MNKCVDVLSGRSRKRQPPSGLEIAAAAVGLAAALSLPRPAGAVPNSITAPPAAEIGTFNGASVWPRVEIIHVTVRGPNGAPREGATQPVGLPNAGASARAIYPWGELSWRWGAAGKTVRLKGTIIAGAQSLVGLTMQIGEISFPSVPLGNIPDPGQFGMGKPHPLHQFPLEAPAAVMPPVIEADYGSGVLAFCDERVGSNETISIPHSSGSLTRYPLWLRVNSVAPGERHPFSLALRFGTAGSHARLLAHDLYERFAARYPFRLQWSDRRAIGTNFLSSAGNHPPKNPRGWFNNASDVDTTTPAGRAAFRIQLMRYADESIRVLRGMNAQGVITWDPEGQEFDAATYYGDPRLVSALAPEMELRGPDGRAAVDEYFERFRKAGFRVGVCVRPQEIRFVNGVPVQEDSADPGSTLMKKIAYARRRWHCTLFYIDSTVRHEQPLGPAVFGKVAAANRDVLLIPENQTFRDYAVTAPLDSFFHHGVARTSEEVRAAYPGAFTVLLGPGGGGGGTVAAHRPELLDGLKHGDILTFRSWFSDSETVPIQELYREVGVGPAIRISVPADRKDLREGSTLTITAHLAAGSHRIEKVEFFQTSLQRGRTRLGTVLRAPYSFRWRRVPVGTYSLSARVTDSAGCVRTTADRMIRVHPFPSTSLSVRSRSSRKTK